jgi:hypothetical protein
VKSFLKQQKKAERAAAAGGVLAAAAAQFRSSPGPSRFIGRNASNGPAATHDDSRAVDAMQQSSPLHDCSGVGGYEDDESSEQAMDGAACAPDCKAADHSKQQMFTWSDVERIVHSALQQQESELRRHYDEVLQSQLHEQFSNLTRFNQDHIARSMQASTHDYFN